MLVNLIDGRQENHLKVSPQRKSAVVLEEIKNQFEKIKRSKCPPVSQSSSTSSEAPNN